MIETLKGLHETVNFKDESLIKFYDNDDYESYPSHWHNSIEIIMPVKNSYVVSCNQISYHLREGDILIIWPNVLHQMPASQGRRFICQASLMPILSLKMYKSIHSVLPATLLLTPEQDEELLIQVREQLEIIYNEYNTISQTAELSMYISILQILKAVGKVSIDKIPSMQDKDIKQLNQTNNFVAICDYIKNHYTEKLTLEEVAQKSGYSKYHFDRLFKKYNNETFYQYLNRIRISSAEESLIRDNDISITEAAYKSGFSTISSFIRMFKIHHNCTPSEFRSIHASK